MWLRQEQSKWSFSTPTLASYMTIWSCMLSVSKPPFLKSSLCATLSTQGMSVNSSQFSEFSVQCTCTLSFLLASKHAQFETGLTDKSLKGHEIPLFQLKSSSQSFWKMQLKQAWIAVRRREWSGCGMAISVIANVPCISTVTKNQW